jgi:hypothetical protein
MDEYQQSWHSEAVKRIDPCLDIPLDDDPLDQFFVWISAFFRREAVRFIFVIVQGSYFSKYMSLTLL